MSPINSQRGGHGGPGYQRGQSCILIPCLAEDVRIQNKKREKAPIRVKTHLPAPQQHGGGRRWLRGPSNHLMDVEGGDTAAFLPQNSRRWEMSHWFQSGFSPATIHQTGLSRADFFPPGKMFVCFIFMGRKRWRGGCCGPKARSEEMV